MPFSVKISQTGESRWQVIGIASGATVLLVVHTAKTRDEDQTEVIRIISARAATRKEQAIYDEHRS